MLYTAKDPAQRLRYRPWTMTDKADQKIVSKGSDLFCSVLFCSVSLPPALILPDDNLLWDLSPRTRWNHILFVWGQWPRCGSGLLKLSPASVSESRTTDHGGRLLCLRSEG